MCMYQHQHHRMCVLHRHNNKPFIPRMLRAFFFCILFICLTRIVILLPQTCILRKYTLHCHTHIHAAALAWSLSMKKLKMQQTERISLMTFLRNAKKKEVVCATICWLHWWWNGLDKQFIYLGYTVHGNKYIR